MKHREDDLFSDLMLKLCEKRSYIIDIFQDKEEGLIAYIRSMIKNMLNNALISSSKNTTDNIFIYKTYDGEDKHLDCEQFDAYYLDIILNLEAEEVMSKLEKELKIDEFKLLCYILENTCDKEAIEKVFF